MKTPDLLELATRNLRESMLRNSLTTIGIAVGVASLVSMMSLGVGLQRMISIRLEKVGFNLINVIPKAGMRMMGGADMMQAVSSEDRPLNEAARVEIERLPGVVEANPDIRFSADMVFNGKSYSTRVTGIPDSTKVTDDFNNVRGRFFASQQAGEIMIEKAFAAQLLGKTPVGAKRNTPLDVAGLAKDLVGKELTLNYEQRSESNDKAYTVTPRTTTLKIVGVLDIDVQSRYARNGVFLPLKFARNLGVLQFGGGQGYNAIIVTVKDVGQVQKVEDAVKKMGFAAISIQDAMRSLKQGFAIFDMFLGVFGSLALAVASVGIVNTLVMAILERRREIGIMKAIGASDSDVKRVFFAEAGAMGLVGGAAGVLLGWLIGRIINAGTNLYLTKQGAPNTDVWYVSWWLVAGAIGFSLVISLIAGWYPASRASRLDPVEALRYQ